MSPGRTSWSAAPGCPAESVQNDLATISPMAQRGGITIGNCDASTETEVRTLLHRTIDVHGRAGSRQLR
jgi:hypothetical protein